MLRCSYQGSIYNMAVIELLLSVSQLYLKLMPNHRNEMRNIDGVATTPSWPELKADGENRKPGQNSNLQRWQLALFHFLFYLHSPSWRLQQYNEHNISTCFNDSHRTIWTGTSIQSTLGGPPCLLPFLSSNESIILYLSVHWYHPGSGVFLCIVGRGPKVKNGRINK